MPRLTAPTLELISHGSNNNFNLIRLLSAWGVLFAHSYLLVNNRPQLTDPFQRYFDVGMGTFFVTVFFAISGFLIFRSLVRSQDLKRYFWARMIRIVPALAVVLLITAMVLGPLVSSLPAAEYFTDHRTWSYLLNINLLNLHTQFDLPGVFKDTPYPLSVNGSLWTLPIEVWMYVMIAALFCLGQILKDRLSRYTSWLLPLAVVAFSMTICWSGAYYKEHPQADAASMILFCSVFMFGSLMYRYRAFIPLNWLAAAALVAGAYWLKNTAIYPVYYAVTIVYSVLVIAYLPNGFIRSFNKLGDYSYGLYIYAFPVQQTIVFYVPDIAFSTMLLGATCISLIFAIGSWHLIEAPILKTKYKMKARP